MVHYNVGDALSELFEGINSVVAEATASGASIPQNLSELTPEMDAKLKEIAQGVASKLFEEDETISTLHAEHQRYHDAGVAPAHYPTKTHTVHAIQYMGKENLSEVIDFLVDHDMSFAILKSHVGIIGHAAEMEIETVNEGNWIAYRADIDAHQVMSCRDFSFNYDLPADLKPKAEEKSDEPFEGDNSDELFDE